MNAVRAEVVRFHPERGQVGGIEALPFGLLTFVVAAIVVATAWAVVDAKLAVVSAAREGARSYVEADSAATGTATATAAAREALGGQNRDGGVEVTVEQPPAFVRCAAVTVRVATVVPAVRVPWLGGLGSIRVAARHRELVDPYRDGLPGAATCPP
jgi:hypothetical protein